MKKGQKYVVKCIKTAPASESPGRFKYRVGEYVSKESVPVKDLQKACIYYGWHGKKLIADFDELDMEDWEEHFLPVSVKVTICEI